MRETDLEADLFDVHFVDDNEGWAVGTNGMIVHTSDRGTSSPILGDVNGDGNLLEA